MEKTAHDMPLHRSFQATLFCLLCFSQLVEAQPAITPKLSHALQVAGAGEKLIVWVFLTDKGPETLGKLSEPASLLSERSLARRANVLPRAQLVDETDLPVYQEYASRIESAGVTIRHFSKWLNAISVETNPRQISILRSFPFVRELELVARFPKDGSLDDRSQPFELPVPSPGKTTGVNDLDYGASFNQVNQINVPAVHNTGNYGQDVIVGVFDNGFRLPNHEAFDSLTILATYDFVDHKVSVVPIDTRASFGSHGVNTLSTIGGYKPGTLIGPAFKAKYLLARTENDSSETPVEEDNWVRAIEWADSQGVQVTSTSLGYLSFDAPYVSYTWEDMDGKTAIITKAAVMAARKGIVVVNSAGNNGLSASNNTLNAPADADSIISAGAVDASGTRAAFSSVGPTTSVPTRIKPDVMARGVAVLAADAVTPTAYVSVNGTSFSCPLTAGVAALLVRAVPAVTPMQVITALKSTASRATAPDNQYGWGIINAKAAIDYLLATEQPPKAYALLQNYPNPFNSGTTIKYDLPETATVSLKIYNLLGQLVRTIASGTEPAGHYRPRWDGRGEGGVILSTGVYFARLDVSGNQSGTTATSVRKMVLLR
jgi:serine protease AprX